MTNKISNPKSQKNLSFRSPADGFVRNDKELELGHWGFFGHWSLVIGALLIYL